MKKYLYLMAALAIAAVSCKKPEPVTPSITLSTPTEVTVSTDGGIQTVSFSSNVAWTASLDNSNWSVSAASGNAGDASIKVTAPNNTTEDPIVVKLTLKADKASQTVTFTQLQKDAMIVDVTSYEAPAEGGTVSLKVKANVEVTATTDAEWITIPTPTKGLIEKTFDLTVAANDGEAREGTVILSGAGQKVEITVKQAAFVPVFEVDCELFEVSKEGDEFTVNITTNVDFKVTDYHDGSFHWQTATLATDGKTLKVVIDANTGYDVRTSYVKLTVPAIQDPVIDEETGEPTGEYTDHVVRVYFGQEGLVTAAWIQDFTWDLYNESHRYSTAIVKDYLLVSTGLGVKAYSRTDGSFVSNIELPFVPTGITNDDAGNIIVSVGGDYPLDPETWALIPEIQIPLEVYVLPAATYTDPSTAKRIIKYYDGFYGYGLDNIRVTGDATKSACVTMMSAAGAPGTSYAVSWEVVDGNVAEQDGLNPYTDYVTLSWTSEIWNSANMVCKHLTEKVDGGLYAIGYDGNYNLHYNKGMSMANWQEVFVTGSTWAEGYNAMDFIEWNGHRYAAILGMSYFGKCDWGYMPSYLFILNIDVPESPELVSKQELYMNTDEEAGMFVYGSTTDVCLDIENDNLAVYVFDSGISRYQKLIYPKK